MALADYNLLPDRVVNFFSSFFVSDDDVATAKQVAAAQQTVLADQYDRGVIDTNKYLQLSREIDDAGNYLDDYRKDASDPGHLIPWWVWLVVGVAVLIYLWPVLSRLWKARPA